MRHIIQFFIGLLFFSSTAWAQVHELPRSTPEAEGIPSSAISLFLDSLTSYPHSDIHSVMILRHGKVVAELYPEPYKAEYRHTMYSCSKTFVSTAIGIAVDENRLRVTDRVAAFFPELLPEEISPELAAMTIHDLLIMASGVNPDGTIRAENDDWIKVYLSKPVSTPGKKFKYDSLCTYLLSAIIQRVTGMKTLDYLKEKLFNDMHITDVSWEESPEGYNVGGWGLHIQCESLAKMGQLFLQKGKWNGKQLVSEEWVKQMMSNHIATSEEGTAYYGYQMWGCPPNGSFRADGRLGQFILVLPETDMVVAITECTWSPQLRFVWELILPKVQNAKLTTGKDYLRLLKEIKAYHYPTLQGKASSSLMKQLEGKTYTLDKNEFGWKSLSFKQQKNELILSVKDEYGKAYDLSLGFKKWITNEVEGYPLYSMTARQKFKAIEGPYHMAGCYAWSKQTLNFKIEYVDWISATEISLVPEGNQIILKVRKNYQGQEEEMRGVSR